MPRWTTPDVQPVVTRGTALAGFARRLARAAAGLWLLPAALLAAHAADAPAPQPIEHFTRWADIDSVVVSPSGQRLAVLSKDAKGRQRLAVMDLDPVGEPHIVAAFGDADIERVSWVNDQRLVFEAAQPERPVVRAGGGGVFAVNHDGSGQRQLISWRRSTENIPNSQVVSRILPWGWYLDGPVGDDSDDVLIHRTVRDAAGDVAERLPARLNTATGELRRLSLGMPEGVRQWWFDAAGDHALIATRQGDRVRLLWRADPKADWQPAAEFEAYVWDFIPRFIDADRRIIVSAQRGSDASRLFVFDPKTRKVGDEALLGVPGFDVDATAVRGQRSDPLAGVRFTADVPMTYWFDPGLAALQKAVDAALPAGRHNQLYCGRCARSRFMVIVSASDRQPGELFLLDRSKGSMQRLGVRRPWIDEALQGRRSLHRVKMRDGLEIPVYVTHPAGAQADVPLPTVVLVHGGPWVRGSNLAWEAEAQFLASRGYRVLEPEFRGSTGYGARLWKAGFKQWGRAMQDDLVDALKWAAERKLSDPDRACLMGASYGGYAALMGPVTHPGQWRCAISFAGVTDIQLMYDIHRSNLPDEWKQYGMPQMIGDPKTDAATLAAASPLRRVAEIKVPVLLAHGGDDRRVPIEHARAFLSAAKSAGVAIDSVEYPYEGHGWYDPANRADFYRRVEALLARTLAARP